MLSLLEKIRQAFTPVRKDRGRQPVEVDMLHAERQRVRTAQQDQERLAAKVLRELVCKNEKERGQ